MSDVRLLDYWSAPDGAGAPVACLTTTFTFDADFFTQDCLSRFLGLSTAPGEGDQTSSIVALLEEEERLSEAQVTVLVDRSTSAEKRNLRWDLLPVAAPGGLLHAKVAVLLWQRHCRIIVGSANLTPAGYRSQVEIALAIDLDSGCQVPRATVGQLSAELKRLVELAPGTDGGGPKQRAQETLQRLNSRIDQLDLPESSSQVRLALAPSRPGVSPLDRLGDVWHGAQPLRATVLSPFWDDEVPAPAISAVKGLLTGRPAERRRLNLVAAIDPHTGGVQGPRSLATQPGARLLSYQPAGNEPRRLHAKLILVETDSWVAALIGSSNATAAGLGLHPGRGHEELNLWIGCPANSADAKKLRALARIGSPLRVDDQEWDATPDEDEATGPRLPLGFQACLIQAGTPSRTHLTFDADRLPAVWEVRDPLGCTLLDSPTWRTRGAARESWVELPAGPLPAYLLVRWDDDDGAPCEATWTANIDNRGALPPPAELSQLPVQLLLAALASTRPLPVAVEQELRRRGRTTSDPANDVDPLRRFADTGMLLRRMRQHSLALWRLQQRLGQPASSIDTVRWRMHGVLGPVAIAEALRAATSTDQALPGEPQFMLAELALTIKAVDWSTVAAGLDRRQLDHIVTEALDQLQACYEAMPEAPDPAIDSYVREALKEVAAR